jgi:hypothetical protein
MYSKVDLPAQFMAKSRPRYMTYFAFLTSEFNLAVNITSLIFPSAPTSMAHVSVYLDAKGGIEPMLWA